MGLKRHLLPDLKSPLHSQSSRKHPCCGPDREAYFHTCPHMYQWSPCPGGRIGRQDRLPDSTGSLTSSSPGRCSMSFFLFFSHPFPFPFVPHIPPPFPFPPGGPPTAVCWHLLGSPSPLCPPPLVGLGAHRLLFSLLFPLALQLLAGTSLGALGPPLSPPSLTWNGVLQDPSSSPLLTGLFLLFLPPLPLGVFLQLLADTNFAVG